MLFLVLFERKTYKELLDSLLLMLLQDLKWKKRKKNQNFDQQALALTVAVNETRFRGVSRRNQKKLFPTRCKERRGFGKLQGERSTMLRKGSNKPNKLINEKTTKLPKNTFHRTVKNRNAFSC